MKKIVLSIAIALISLSLVGQELNIKGIIIDKNTRESLPGANIFLLNDWKVGSIADNKGSFNLRIKENALSDSLIISYVGYREKHISVTLVKDMETIIELEPFAQLLTETVITARRIIAEEFTVKQMKQLDIYLNPAAKADPLLAINAMPSSTTTDESASISLRGSRPDETGIFLNDVPIYDAIRFSQLNGIGTFSIFNTSIVDRMHVFAGNPPLEYGNSASGLVSLQTYNNILNEDLNTISLGFASVGAFTSRKITDKTGLTVFANYSPSEILTGLNQDALEDLEDFNSLDLGLHFLYNMNSKTRFKLFNYSNSEGYDFKLRHPSYSGIFDMDKKRNFTVSNFIMQQNKSEFTVNAGYNLSSEKYVFGNTDIDIDKQDMYFSSNYQYFFNKISVKTGTSIDYRQNSASGMKPMLYYGQNPENPIIQFSSDESIMLTEIFLYSKFNLSKKLILGSGIRKNIVINDEPNMLSYQANLNFKPNKMNSITLSAGHYNRLSMPNAEQISVTHFESDQVTLDYNFVNENFELQTSLFAKNVTYSNNQNSIYGAEIYSKIQLNPFEIQLSFTSLDAKIKSENTKYPSDYDLDYFIRGVIKYKLKDIVELNAIYIFRQGCYYKPIVGSTFIDSFDIYSPEYSSWENAKRLPDYHKLDITATKYWVLNANFALVVYGSISNIFNTDNVMSKNYNSDYSESFNELYSKRTYYFGVSIMF